MSHRRERKQAKKEKNKEKNKNRTILVISDCCSMEANKKYWREHKDD